MRSLDINPPRILSQRFLTTIAVLIFGAIAVNELTSSIINNDTIGLVYIGLGVLLFIALLKILNDWRSGVLLFLAWLLFEDFARKFLGNNVVMFFGKDVLALLLYLSFYKACLRDKIKIFHAPFRLPL